MKLKLDITRNYMKLKLDIIALELDGPGSYPSSSIN